ncbi:MAG: metal ABC transporter solute-binding protein, Zn/Mn family [bacterium]
MKKIIVILVSLSFLLCFHPIPAHQSGSGTEERKIGVVVTILPLAEFVEKTGKERVEVSVMVPPGANPHTYEPTPGQLKKVSQARMYVKVGSGIEFEMAWMAKLISLNRKMLVCNSSEGLPLLEMKRDNQSQGQESTPPPKTLHEPNRQYDNHHDHDRGHHDRDEHRHHGHDPHLWLSPVNVMSMVVNIRDALIRVDPEGSSLYTRGSQGFILELKQLDNQIRERLSSLKTRSFLSFHPAWGYFASTYGLEQIPVELEGKEPSARDLVRIIRLARDLNLKVIFTSPQFSRKSAEVIAGEIRGKVIFLDPLAKNYIENLHEVANALLVQGPE